MRQVPTKTVAQGEASRERLLNGARLAARLAGVTLGPQGGHVALDRAFGYPEITKDGFTAIRDLDHPDRVASLGIELIKACAKKTRDTVGDGSTTASVLAGGLCVEGLRLVAAGYPPVDLRRVFDAMSAEICDSLAGQSRPAHECAVLEAVACRATGGDREIAAVVARAVHQLGPDGVINVAYHQGVDTTVDFMSGMKFEHGMLSRHFLATPRDQAVKLDQPYLLLCAGPLARADDVVPALEAAKRDERSLLVLAEDVTDQALAVMLTNNKAGTVRCAAVKGPGSGIYRHHQTDDIAVLTGGEMFSEELGNVPERIAPGALGRCKRAVIEVDSTTLFGGLGSPEACEARIAQIRTELTRETKHYDRGKLETRLARLVSGVANIRVGGYTESAWRERQTRAENAVNAARAALTDGVVAGGGVALLRAAALLADRRDPPALAFRRILETPFRLIAERSGREPSLLAEAVLALPARHGYDSGRDRVCDYAEAGVIDSVAVLRRALTNAVSTAGQILMADCVVALADPPKGATPA